MKSNLILLGTAIGHHHQISPLKSATPIDWNKNDKKIDKSKIIDRPLKLPKKIGPSLPNLHKILKNL